MFSFQDQNDIARKSRLFHRQEEEFVGQAIRDTRPYFLGAIDEDRFLRQDQLDHAPRQIRKLERQLREAESLDSITYPRAWTLLEEAKDVGLVADGTTAASHERMIDVLRRIASDTRVRDQVVMADGEDLLSGFRAECGPDLRTELERVNAEVRSTIRLRRRQTL